MRASPIYKSSIEARKPLRSLLLGVATVLFAACTNSMEKRELDSAHAECVAQGPQIESGTEGFFDVVVNCFEPKEFAIKQKYAPGNMDLLNLYFAERRALVQAVDRGTMSIDQLQQSMTNLRSEYDEATEQRAIGQIAQAFIGGVAAAAQAKASVAPVQSQTYSASRTPVVLHTTCQWIGAIAGLRPQFNCTTTAFP